MWFVCLCKRLPASITLWGFQDFDQCTLLCCMSLQKHMQGHYEKDLGKSHHHEIQRVSALRVPTLKKIT